LLTYTNDSKAVGKPSDHKAVETIELGSSVFLSIGKLAEARKVALRRGVRLMIHRLLYAHLVRGYRWSWSLLIKLILK